MSTENNHHHDHSNHKHENDHSNDTHSFSAHNYHEDEHTTKASFGKNTTGIGLAIVAALAALMVLFAWNTWKVKGFVNSDNAGAYKAGGTAEHGGGHGQHAASAAEHGTTGEHGAAADHKASGENHAGTAGSLGTIDTTTGNFVYNTGSNTTITLPNNGGSLQVGDNSTESKLYKMLSDASFTVDSIDKTKGWVSCDRLYFETGKNVLTAESQKQVANIAAIMKAFPNCNLKFGGYTDNTGNAAANLKLSQSRAEAAFNAVVKLGTDKARGKAEGYGQEHPIADNATVAGRAQNRRVDVRITKK
jgi:outer membrane protein OmpA-like peptidoglycan-associated protein